MPGVSNFRQHLKFYLSILALTGIIFIIARPQFGSKLETIKKKGLEVMVCLDISNSMLAEDVQPNRLEKSKQMLYKLLDGLNNDKFGVIIFAGHPYTQLPITTDYQSAKIFISTIQPNIIRQQGTAIGAALEMASKAFSEEEVNKGQAIIVITDGENHEDDAVSMAQQIAAKGIQVNVIGIGKPEGSPIPVSGTNNFKKDKDGNVVISKLNETMCQEIARAGNGTYIRADNTNNAMKVIQSELNKIAHEDVESKVYSEYNEQFPPIVLIVIIILIIELIILERKNGLFRNFKLFD
jgi:Ca-activated chloride channel family protein